jgi:beta-galactosidase
MKKMQLLFIASCMFFLSNAQVNQGRIKYNFNPSWKMFVGDDSLASTVTYNDASWKPVTLPHAFNEDDAFKVSIEKHATGIVWYRKHFKIDSTQAGKKIFLEFEGIRQAGDFYLNGKSIGFHENGVMAFGFDISNDIHFGQENIIAVRIDNSWNYHERATNSGFQWSDKNFNANYGGISKNVYLHVADRLYQTLPLYSNLKTTGVYVYATDMDIANKNAIIHAESEVRNEYSVAKTFKFMVRVDDAVTGKRLATIEGGRFTLQPNETKIIKASSLVSNLHFWSWGYGYLYKVTTILNADNVFVDAVTTTTGFRKTAFNNGALTLNDRVLHLKGYAQRSSNEWPSIGLSVPAWLSDYSNGLMVESNANLVRWMHITPWKQDVESCDRVGLVQAMPAGDSEKDVEGRRWEQRKEVMRDAIIYNRNNPSIIFYECGNNQISEPHMKEMKDIRNAYDPNGGRAIGSRNMLDSKEAEYGGEMLYINKSAAKPMWQMEYSRDEGLRKYWDEYSPPYHKEGEGPLHNGQDASSYNHNQDAHAIENIVRWFEYWHERPGTGKRVNGGGVNIIFSESNTHHRGAENFRRSGEVDALRIKKDGFYANQIMWDGWVNVEKPRIHIIGHWNYKEGVTKSIYVISSAEKVELFVNGKSLGFGEQSNRFLYTFKNITWKAGNIAAIGYDAADKKLCETKHETAGEPFAVKLTQINPSKALVANGADLALVEVEVVDAKGNRCPTALNEINFALNGEAEWRGGMAQGPDNYILSKTLPVECGVNRFLIRSTTKVGSIGITATSKGLKEAIINIKSVPFKAKDGLSLQMPSDGLASNLSRGETPATPSFVSSRKTMEIVSATAGANQEKATASYDDNEASDWVNDGKLGTAWIEYEIANASTINEVSLKLNNFRTRSYPIKISIDGTEVFKGNTTRNLGYFTASFPPASGKKIKIELIGQADVKDDSAKEVNGKKLDDGVARNDANSKGTFAIIEAEIYGPVK